VCKETPVKDGKKPSKSRLKSASSKSDLKKWKSAPIKEKKVKQVATNETKKDTNITVEKRRVGRPCKVKTNAIISGSAAKREGENASSSVSQSSLPSPFAPPSPSPILPEVKFQQRIAKRKRDPWISDSECSAESEWNVL
jgi:hypothetical protein